ncbi:hypothetical protein BJ684DRAFT_14788 [Piptocephalis cylindrospora]|uniref:Exportin-4 n=1 Tax=Piptocephalis cylindrospora TaxID=1907219 RepID=A0A4P9YA45_9FUNG|nr:hypothetical protein BJ684DRAFT_14788 [Piptocephalis cylindrospora]|eukprot:RKP14920.1 hypothetical protein BJ684DRAFT_14788 [Piptocephalis cylindrospora]
MDPSQVLGQIEQACRDLETPERRQQAEQVILQIGQTPECPQLCQYILAHSTLPMAQFQAAVALRHFYLSGSIHATVNSLSSDPFQSTLLAWIFSHLLSSPPHHPLLPSVRDELLSTAGILLKRTLHSTPIQWHSMIHLDGPDFQDATPNVLTPLRLAWWKVLLREFSLMDPHPLGIPWEMHLQAKRGLEENELLGMMEFTLQTLFSAASQSNMAILADALILSEMILQWPFGLEGESDVIKLFYEVYVFIRGWDENQDASTSPIGKETLEHLAGQCLLHLVDLQWFSRVSRRSGGGGPLIPSSPSSSPNFTPVPNSPLSASSSPSTATSTSPFFQSTSTPPSSSSPSSPSAQGVLDLHLSYISSLVDQGILDMGKKGIDGLGRQWVLLAELINSALRGSSSTFLSTSKESSTFLSHLARGVEGLMRHVYHEGPFPSLRGQGENDNEEGEEEEDEEGLREALEGILDSIAYNLSSQTLPSHDDHHDEKSSSGRIRAGYHEEILTLSTHILHVLMDLILIGTNEDNMGFQEERSIIPWMEKHQREWSALAIIARTRPGHFLEGLKQSFLRVGFPNDTSSSMVPSHCLVSLIILTGYFLTDDMDDEQPLVPYPLYHQYGSGTYGDGEEEEERVQEAVIHLSHFIQFTLMDQVVSLSRDQQSLELARMVQSLVWWIHRWSKTYLFLDPSDYSPDSKPWRLIKTWSGENVQGREGSSRYFEHSLAFMETHLGLWKGPRQVEANGYSLENEGTLVYRLLRHVHILRDEGALRSLLSITTQLASYSSKQEQEKFISSLHSILLTIQSPQPILAILVLQPNLSWFMTASSSSVVLPDDILLPLLLLWRLYLERMDPTELSDNQVGTISGIIQRTLVLAQCPESEKYQGSGGLESASGQVGGMKMASLVEERLITRLEASFRLLSAAASWRKFYMDPEEEARRSNQMAGVIREGKGFPEAVDLRFKDVSHPIPSDYPSSKNHHLVPLVQYPQLHVLILETLSQLVSGGQLLPNLSSKEVLNDILECMMMGLRQLLPGPAIAAYLAVQAIIGAWRGSLATWDQSPVQGKTMMDRGEDPCLRGFVGQVELLLLEQFFTGALQGERVPEATETLLACMLTLPEAYLEFKEKLLGYPADSSGKKDLLTALGRVEAACPPAYFRSFSLHVLDAFREALDKAIRLSWPFLKMH